MTQRRKNARLEHALAPLRELAPSNAFVRTEGTGPVVIRTKSIPTTKG